MANYLFLNQNYIQSGLGTLTFDVPATVMVPGNGAFITTSQVPFTVRCQVTVPGADSQGAGSGSGVDRGLGALGGSQGIGQGSNLSLGNGGKGLGFGGSPGNAYNLNGNGHGAGAGGGTVSGFARGGAGTGDGAVGQGFGADQAGYPQPLTDVIVPSVSASPILSQLSVVVNYNGTPYYTSPTLEGNQLQLEFQVSHLCNATDVLTIVLSSSAAQDTALNAIKANISVVQG